ncbi:MAG TPA: hypothetical protein VF175_06360 [Lacipirellula sp.]
MSDSAEEIVQRMQEVRRGVGDDVRGIVETAKTLTDWRYHVKHHPWLLVGGAVALGFLVAPRKKKIPASEAQELAALLKKYNVSVAAPATPSKSLFQTALGMAVPFAMRSIASAAQSRFAGNGGPLGAMFGGERPPESVYEDFNIPR